MIVFLLGLFVGGVILFVGFILGLLFGFGLKVNKAKTEKAAEPMVIEQLPKQLLLVMEDYGELVDWVVESYENGSQELTVQFPTDEGDVSVRFVSKERYLESCLNIDDEG
jgi:hypothetical protein